MFSFVGQKTLFTSVPISASVIELDDTNNLVQTVSPSKNETMMNVVSAMRPMDSRIPGVPAFNSPHSRFHQERRHSLYR